MPEPTRQEIINAHDALIELCRLAEELAVTEVQDRQAWKYHASIRAALPPRPQPTMDEIEWDDDEHFLAEAENTLGMRFLMVCKHDSFNIRCLGSSTLQGRIIGAEFLTPTGRRYTLTEVQE